MSSPDTPTREPMDEFDAHKALANVLLAHQPRRSPLGDTLCACGMSFKAIDARAWHRHAAAMVENYLAALPPARPAEPTPSNCDGCAQGLPIKDGQHYRDGLPWIGCTASRYAAPLPSGEPTSEAVAWGVTQTITGDDGNCLEAAIATVTGIPLDEFPLDLLGHPETHPKWFSRLREWLYFHDWTMDEVYGDPPSGLHVAVGPSPRKAGSHAVVVLNGHYVFDPHPSRAFFGAGEAKYYITLDRRVRHPLPPLAASPATDERLDDRALEAAMRTLVTGLDRGTVWFNLLPECIRAYLSAHPATRDAERQGEALPTPPAVTAGDFKCVKCGESYFTPATVDEAIKAYREGAERAVPSPEAGSGETGFYSCIHHGTTTNTDSGCCASAIWNNANRATPSRRED